jgi:hypothetical protein
VASSPFAAGLPPVSFRLFHPKGMSGRRRDHFTASCNPGCGRRIPARATHEDLLARRAAVIKARPLDVASLNCLWHGSAMAKLERRAIEPLLQTRCGSFVVLRRNELGWRPGARVMHFPIHASYRSQPSAVGASGGWDRVQRPACHCQSSRA